MISIKRSQPPIQKIIIKLLKYFVFTIIMSWSSIAVNGFVCYLFDLSFKEMYLYTPEICFMTIILASMNLKDLLESNIPSDKLIFIFHIVINIIDIVLSLIFIGISSYIELSNIVTKVPIQKQYHFVLATYLIAVFLGSSVQIGGVMKWKK